MIIRWRERWKGDKGCEEGDGREIIMKEKKKKLGDHGEKEEEEEEGYREKGECERGEGRVGRRVNGKL